MNSKRDFPVVIGDKTYLLRFGFGALTAAEDLTGKTFAELCKGLMVRRLSDVKVLFYAGVRKHHPNVAIDNVDDILDDSDDLDGLFTTLTSALENYLKPKATDDAKKKKEVQPSTIETDESITDDSEVMHTNNSA